MSAVSAVDDIELLAWAQVVEDLRACQRRGVVVDGHGAIRVWPVKRRVVGLDRREAESEFKDLVQTLPKILETKTRIDSRAAMKRLGLTE